MSGIRNYLRPFWMRLILAALVALIFTSVLRATYGAIHRSNNVAQLEELNLRSLQRAEVLVDYAVETLVDLEDSGLSSCDRAALERIQQVSLYRGSIKDIQVLDADHGLLCAGNALSAALGVANFDFSASFPAVQEEIYFHDITRNNSGILGVALHVDEDTTYLAVLNLDSLLFGIFPEQVRQQARADLVIGENVEVASQFPEGTPEIEPSKMREFVSSSEKYPMRVTFKVDEEVLDSWNSDIKNLAGEISLVIGLMLGWGLLVYLARPVPLVRQIRRGMANGEFVPFMQPIFDIKTCKIVGCEILTRWLKPDGEILPPFRFIPTAEESGLIVPMTRLVMADALEKLGAHLRADKNFKVAFNIVPADLLSKNFEDQICKIVKDAGVELRQVVLEITERQEFSDQEQAISVIKRLRETGFQVALDDTGVGHNGLSNVQKLGADIIKIDKIFIDRVGVDTSATTIVQMLVRLAHELDMRTVAEGIETKEQLAELAACKVDEGQGYLVSKPVSFGEFEKLVSIKSGQGGAASHINVA